MLKGLYPGETSLSYAIDLMYITKLIPLSRPFFVFALHSVIAQFLPSIELRSNYSDISTDVNSDMSCLLQKTSRGQPASFGSFNSLCSSFLLSEILSLSPESTTQIKPSD